jgi:pyrimidine operon attenuation protein/uracil phosphoribosyltransferase
LDGDSKRARRVTIVFSGATTIGYEWRRGRWFRSQAEEPFMAESGRQIAVDNVLIEQHRVDFSNTIRDSAGNPSVEITDVTGSGKAVLFRDGRMVRGRWVRAAADDPVRFETRDGDAMVLHPGTTWIELVPSGKGDVKGSFSVER